MTYGVEGNRATGMDEMEVRDRLEDGTYRLFISLLHVISRNAGVRATLPTMPSATATRVSITICRE